MVIDLIVNLIVGIFGKTKAEKDLEEQRKVIEGIRTFRLNVIEETEKNYKGLIHQYCKTILSERIQFFQNSYKQVVQGLLAKMIDLKQEMERHYDDLESEYYKFHRNYRDFIRREVESFHKNMDLIFKEQGKINQKAKLFLGQQIIPIIRKLRKEKRPIHKSMLHQQLWSKVIQGDGAFSRKESFSFNCEDNVCFSKGPVGLWTFFFRAIKKEFVPRVK